MTTYSLAAVTAAVIDSPPSGGEETRDEVEGGGLEEEHRMGEERGETGPDVLLFALESFCFQGRQVV